MRRARRVIVFLLILLAAAGISAQQAAAPAEGSVDTDVTVIGRDDSIISLPEPEGGGDELVLPPLDSDQPDAILVPAMLPPLNDPSAPPQADAAGGGPARSSSQ
jgi:hypothetical protein